MITAVRPPPDCTFPMSRSMPLPTRLLLIVTGFLAVLATADRASAQGKARKPNVLFIFTDDQSYRTVSCYPGAYAFAKTPNIDKLARMGVRFAAAYNGSWCAPSRAAILTGRHPFSVESMTFKGQYPSSSYDLAQCRFLAGRVSHARVLHRADWQMAHGRRCRLRA